MQINRQGLDRIKNRNKECCLLYHNKLAYKQSAQIKDQRSDGLTYKLLVVFIQRNTKHSMRIVDSEDGLNNYLGEGNTRIN